MSRKAYNWETVLGNQSLPVDDRLRFLAVLNLGLVEALERELLSIADAEELLYHGKNGYLVADHCPGDLAEDILARGIQLGDLKEALSSEEMASELRRELNALRHDSVALLRELELRRHRSESEAVATGAPASTENPV